MEQLGSKLRLAYYDASDGPRLMIFGPAGADFAALRQLFKEMSLSPGQTVALHEKSFVAAFGGTALTLLSTGSSDSTNRGFQQGVRRVVNTTTPVFQWMRSTEGWDYLAELIEPLATRVSSGHQYLTRYPDEDAIVVVSQGEYGDEVLQG